MSGNKVVTRISYIDLDTTFDIYAYRKVSESEAQFLVDEFLRTYGYQKIPSNKAIEIDSSIGLHDR